MQCGIVNKKEVKYRSVDKAIKNAVASIEMEGFEVDEIIVTDGNNEKVEVGEDGTFKMPANGAKVTATFKDAPEEIEVDDSTEHGTVSVEPANAAEGEKVTITAEPEEGFEVDEKFAHCAPPSMQTA